MYLKLTIYLAIREEINRPLGNECEERVGVNALPSSGPCLTGALGDHTYKRENVTFGR